MSSFRVWMVRCPRDEATTRWRLARVSGFTQARVFNRVVKDPDLDAEANEWQSLLEKKGSAYRAETIARAYDGAIARAVRVETKAIALLQVVAIGFAIVALIAGHRGWLFRLLSLVAIAYLLLATLGALEVLKVRAQRQVVSIHAKDGTGGHDDLASDREQRIDLHG